LRRGHRVLDPSHPRSPHWRRRAVYAALGAALAFSAPAYALIGAGAEQIDRAVEGLKNGPVYVDPESTTVLSPDEATALANEIGEKNAGPLYVVVLPSSAAEAVGGDPVGVLREVQNKLNRPGTYAGVIGNHFRAGATGGILPRGKAGKLADAAFNAHHSEGVDAVLSDFVARIGDTRNGGSGSSSDDSGGGIVGWIIAALAGLGIGGWLLARRRGKRRELEQVKHVARDDLIALGDEIRALDVDVAMPNANADAKAHYNEAVEIYKSAEESLARARRPDDLQPVSAELERGRFEMQSAQALLEGKEPPERRAPCFFDPRHGPSTRMVDWAPPGGTPRPVPACEVDAERVEQGFDPKVREIEYGGRRVPYWAAPAPYTPFFGGFYGGYGDGFLPGLLVGEMLGGGFGGWGAGGSWSDPGDAGSGSSGSGNDGGDFADGGGGDFSDSGGGDFGGGDFGGGDSGGGDFGGGDSGGGDSGGGGGDF
jgi:hypothetical protein